MASGKLRPERAIRPGSAAANCGGREFLRVGEAHLYIYTRLEICQRKQFNSAAIYREEKLKPECICKRSPGSHFSSPSGISPKQLL